MSAMNPADPSSHPSYLELDRYHLGGEAGGSPSLRAHLAGCPRCAGYLTALRSTRDSGTPEWLARLSAVPPRTQGLGSSPGARSTGRRWIRRAAVTLLASSAAAVVLALPRSGPPLRPEPPLLLEKGEPAVTVFLKRAERVWQWDGRSVLRPGDRLRLKISAAGYGYVAIGAPDAEPHRVRLLYEGPLTSSGPDTLLPSSWEVDAQPGPEVLHVLLSREPLPKKELQRAPGSAELPDSTGAVWRKTLVLPKERAP
jgi:hypothetical protein